MRRLGVPRRMVSAVEGEGLFNDATALVAYRVAVGASGILATVTAGIYMGIRGPAILPTRTRLQGYFVWDSFDFTVDAILFVLIGLQLRAVLDGLPEYSAGTLAGYALAVSGRSLSPGSSGSSRSPT